MLVDIYLHAEDIHTALLYVYVLFMAMSWVIVKLEFLVLTKTKPNYKEKRLFSLSDGNDAIYFAHCSS